MKIKNEIFLVDEIISYGDTLQNIIEKYNLSAQDIKQLSIYWCGSDKIHILGEIHRKPQPNPDNLVLTSNDFYL